MAAMDGSRAETTPQAAVFGLGNVLMGDDAAGPAVIAHLLAGHELPPGVTVEDLGTPGLDLHPHLAGHRRIIIVDAVRAAGEPGEIRLYSLQEVLAHLPQPRVSPHDPGLKEALLSLEFAGSAPEELLLVGVIPATVAHATKLSEAVRLALPAALQAVLDQLAAWDLAAPPRPTPAAPDLWWE